MSFSRRDFLKKLFLFLLFPTKFLFANNGNSKKIISKFSSFSKNTQPSNVIPPIYLKDKADIALSLRYVDTSPKKDKNCQNCLYYASNKKEGPCNFPVLVKRLGHHPYVQAQGYCTMWKAKA